MTLQVAVDQDHTLSATQAVAFDLLHGDDHDMTYEDVESWQWGIEKYGAARYLSSLWHAWTIRPGEIELADPTVPQAMTKLYNAPNVGTVDVVSAFPDHLGIEDAKETWLDRHRLDYDSLVRAEPDTSKAELNYDVYIDDKPTLPSTAKPSQTVYVYDRPHNRSASGKYIRIETLMDAASEITDRRGDSDTTIIV